MKHLCSLFTDSLVCILIASVLIVGCSRPNIHDAIKKGDKNSLIKALERGANVNEINEEGFTPLYVAVKRCDTAAVRILLEHNSWVSEKATTTKIIDAALINLVPLDSIEKWQKQDLNYPSIKVFHHLMNIVRLKEMKMKKIDLNGTLTFESELGRLNKDGGASFTERFYITSNGDKYELNLSRKETELVNIEKTDSPLDWNIVLIPDAKYRVKGYLGEDGIIESTYLSLDEQPANIKKITYTTSNFLRTSSTIISVFAEKYNNRK